MALIDQIHGGSEKCEKGTTIDSHAIQKYIRAELNNRQKITPGMIVHNVIMAVCGIVLLFGGIIEWNKALKDGRERREAERRYWGYYRASEVSYFDVARPDLIVCTTLGVYLLSKLLLPWRK